MPWDWFFYIVLAAFLVIGLFLTVASLPGLWLMVAATCVYAWLTRDEGFVGSKSLIALVLMGLAAEAIELLAGSATAKRAGGSKRAALGAIVGALLGAILITFAIPIPVIGSVLGACIGAFLGALVAEFTTGKGTGQSVRVGVAAAKGRFIGIVAKLSIGVAMLIVAMWAALPLRSRAAKPSPAPATTPTVVSPMPS